MIATWEQRLKEQRQRDFKNYTTLTLDLSSARDNQSFFMPGDFLYVDKASSAAAAATVRLNRNTNEPIDLKSEVLLKTVFTEIFVSNQAQAGEWITLIIGVNFEYSKPKEIVEAQQVINLTHANADTNVTAGSHVCSEAIIKADVKNTQTVWIDCGAAAVQGDCYPLDPGEWVKVGLSNTNQINANFEVGGEKVYIVYEV